MLTVDTGTNKFVSTRDSDLDSRGRAKQDMAKFLFVVGVLNEMGTCLLGDFIDLSSWEHFTD